MRTPPHNANAVFNAIKQRHNLPTDAAMGALLGVRTDAISSMRAGRIPFGPTIQQKILDNTKLSKRAMQALMDQPADEQ